VAWSGAAPIARVEVAVDAGPGTEARLVGEASRHGWRWWELVASIDRWRPDPLILDDQALVVRLREKGCAVGTKIEL
jgi:hypothetical protein